MPRIGIKYLNNMNKSVGEAICEEFCDKVERGFVQNIFKGFAPDSIILPMFNDSEADPIFGKKVEEIKCVLNIEHFTPLVERMVQAGYCCTQVQKDHQAETCVAWFQPQDEEKLF
jgi:hypothetical protein